MLTLVGGLSSFNEKYAYSPRDLPNHLRPTLEARNKADIPIVTLWLEPDAAERVELRETIRGAEDLTEIKITRFYDGHYSYEVIRGEGLEAPLDIAPPDISSEIQALKNSAGSLKDRLMAHANRHTGFAASLPQAIAHLDNFIDANFAEPEQISNLTKTLAAALGAVPNQDQPVQEDIASMVTEQNTIYAEIQSKLSVDRRSYLRSRVPKFVFHSTSIDRIPNDVSLAEFLKDPETTSKGMANLCLAAAT